MELERHFGHDLFNKKLHLNVKISNFENFPSFYAVIMLTSIISSNSSLLSWMIMLFVWIVTRILGFNWTKINVNMSPSLYCFYKVVLIYLENFNLFKMGQQPLVHILNQLWKEVNFLVRFQWQFQQNLKALVCKPLNLTYNLNLTLTKSQNLPTLIKLNSKLCFTSLKINSSNIMCIDIHHYNVANEMLLK